MTLPAEALARLLGVPFSAEQLAAITAPLEPAVIVAGAGSGKTTVMAARVVWLVATGQVRPVEVLGLTFTNKAAGELAARVTAALQSAGIADSAAADGDGQPMVATYHAFAGRLIAEHGLRLGVEPDARLVADAERYCLAAQTVRRAPGPLRHVSTDLPTLTTAVLTLDAGLAEHLVAPADLRAFSPSLADRLRAEPSQRAVSAVLSTVDERDELLALVQRYRRDKRERGLMDFADQMALGALLAERCPVVGRTERERFRVVLLDEYQDTSVAQRRMLAALFSGRDPAHGRGHPVTAVGDPCQAIYGWRGASVANLDDFPGHFPRPDGRPARRYPLSTSRRCATGILAAANRHAEPLYAAHPGTTPLQAPAGAPAGRIRVALHESYADELGWLATEVARTKAETPGLRWADIGVLVHDNADAAAAGAALRAAQVPVEVVGLGGLLATPEVSEVVAVLEVLHDLTANAALLRLLTGPRWRIGPRDLALLGRRARALAAGVPPEPPADLAAALERAAVAPDPAETASLAEALADPGALPYSAEARRRFSALGAELHALGRYATGPLPDLVRRVVETTGLDAELATVDDDAGRTAVGGFLDAVAEYARSGEATSLAGLLAYLRAEADYGQGLAVSAPTAADSVKVLTVHKAKGLEWDVVFLPMLADRVFPSRRGRPRWPTCAAELPWPLRGDAATLPRVGDWSAKGLAGFRAAAREHDLLEECRLGYVAVTRARHLLVASAHWWGPTQVNPRGPSPYLRSLAEVADDPPVWAPAPPEGETNPALADATDVRWPADPDPVALAGRQAAAAMVEESRRCATAGEAYDGLSELSAAERELVAAWDADLEQLLAEARGQERDEQVVELPPRLSATQLLALRADPAGLARDLARPMPRPPAPAARRGTAFHAWVEARGAAQPLLRPDDLPGAADAALADDPELRLLCALFEQGPYADLVPAQVEAPFSLLLAGLVVRGRIDAVYETAGGFQVVDWKTSPAETADPLQLAVYRLAWAELHGVAPESVDAVFYHVRSGVVERPDRLPDRAGLEALLAVEAAMT